MNKKKISTEYQYIFNLDEILDKFNISEKIEIIGSKMLNDELTITVIETE